MTPLSGPKARRRLSVGAHPLKGESLPGFIVRFAELARFPGADKLAGQCGLRQPGSAFDGADLNALAHLAGIEADALMSISYLPQIRRVHHAFLGGVVHREFIDVMRRRWCPSCLLESRHHRAAWDFTLSTACPEHGTRLLQCCTACGKQVRWSLPRLTRCGCGADIAGDTAPAASLSEIEASRRLIEVIDGRSSTWLPPALHSCDPVELVWLGMCLGMFITGWTRQRRVETLVAEGPDAVARVSIAGSTALADWPASLAGFLANQRAGSQSRKGVYGARKSLGDFYGWLTALEDGPVKAAVAEVARDYVLQDTALARRVHRSRLVAPAERLNLVGLNEAASLIGVSSERVKRMIAARELPRSESEGRGVPMLIDRFAVEAVAERLRGTLDLAATAKVLGISKARLSRLVGANLLQPVHRANEGASATWSFNKDEVASFLDRAEVVRARMRRGERAVGFEFAVESLRRHGIDLVASLRLILDGELPVTGLDRKAGGLKRLRFRATTVRERGRAGNNGASMTIQAAGERLGLKWEVVAHLVKHELLHALDGLVLEAALRTFEESYVTGAELARFAGTSPRAMAVRLEREGILPAAGPSVDGSRQNFYCRHGIGAVSPQLLRCIPGGAPNGVRGQNRRPP